MGGGLLLVQHYTEQKALSLMSVALVDAEAYKKTLTTHL